MRMFWHGSMAVLLFAGLPSAADAVTDETKAVLSDCNASILTQADVDMCLERVRILDESSPSPQLESLEAKLEEKKSGKRSLAASEPSKPLQPLQEETVGPAAPVAPPGTGFDVAAPPPASDRSDVNSAPSQVGRGDDAHPGSASDDRYGSVETSQGSFADEDEPPVADPPDDAAPDGREADPE